MDKDVARELVALATKLVQASLLDKSTAEGVQQDLMGFLQNLQIDYDLSGEVVKRLQDALMKELKQLQAGQ